MGSLQYALPFPVGEEIEERFLEILRAKMTSSVSMYVNAIRTFQELYGPASWEAFRARQLQRAVRGAAESGVRAADNSLRGFCTTLENGCRGSHEWEKLEDSDDRQAYKFTRCMWADIFRSLGAQEIGVWICEADGPVAAAFNPGIRFQRTKTLMEGGECCDHVYYLAQDDPDP